MVRVIQEALGSHGSPLPVAYRGSRSNVRSGLSRLPWLSFFVFLFAQVGFRVRWGRWHRSIMSLR